MGHLVISGSYLTVADINTAISLMWESIMGASEIVLLVQDWYKMRQFKKW